MNALRKIPLFAATLGLIALIALGEGWCLFERVQASRKAQVKLEQKRREFRSVSAIEPAPTAENATAIEADLARTTHALEIMQAGLRGRGPTAESLRTAVVPERRPDAYFDIATFVEKMRERAQRAGVALRPDARFGFAEYTNVGPELELIPAVFRERLIAQYLLEALFDAHPRQLVAMQRERPLTKAERAAAANASTSRSGGADAGAPDYVEIDPRVSARVPGFVDATAFRLTFVGQTGVLRALLNKLAGFELPLVVRSVEVESAGPTVDGSSSGPSAAGAIEPLIRRTFSRFTVTVEFIDLAEPAH
jgi:hypothetical protein